MLDNLPDPCPSSQKKLKNKGVDQSLVNAEELPGSNAINWPNRALPPILGIGVCEKEHTIV